MQIILFRHGIAQEGHPGLPDAERALTHRGIERTMMAARGLARVADKPDAILTSPKVRATQTAALLGDVFDMVPQVIDALASERVEAIIEMLEERRENEVLLVGHEPTMSGLVERLCAGEDLGGLGGFVELKKAGAALVEAPVRRDEPGTRGVLHWLMPPRMLRAIGESS